VRWWLVAGGWCAGGWRILTSWRRLADQSRGKILTDPASYTIDQLRGTLAAA